MKNNMITHLPINWTDGMKISMLHLFQNYYNTTEALSSYNAIHLNAFNFGVLSGENDTVKGVELKTRKNISGSLLIELDECNVVSQGGHRILFHKEMYGDNYVPSVEVDPRTLDKDTKLYVIVAVSPYNLEPVGTPDPDVVPLHHPYALPKITMHVIPETQVNTDFLDSNFLVVAEVLCTADAININENYIPPTSKIMNNKTLNKLCENLAKAASELRTFSTKIIMKNKGNREANSLVENTFSFCRNINNFYQNEIFFIEQIAKEKPPVFLFEKMTTLAHSLSVSLDIMDTKEREILLRYYYDWSDIKPSDFTGIIDKLRYLDYNHMQIRKSCDVLMEFVNMILVLFKKMSELEYIGQRKENIVIGEDNYKKTNDKDKGWSLID